MEGAQVVRSWATVQQVMGSNIFYVFLYGNVFWLETKHGSSHKLYWTFAD